MKTLALLFVAALIWAAGLLAFAIRIEQSTPAPEPVVADGIVALTGAGSNERIAAGMRLLEAGKGDRMLISGVNREASREDIRNVSRAVQLLYDCCVDLGFEAADTFGNAQETAGWVRARRYDSLIIVTADYHMPRAMLELGSALPGITLQAYPVTTPSLDAQRWWRTTGGARLMVMEYSKYLAILGRELVLRLGPKDEAPPEPASQGG
ncbi:MAG: YdcF family protein [Phenylobacterium sp.]|uniref:YdcF family protein n=1 Tax=Phenylobacterium sp. TaxID=1871053 RepID=UPI0027376847|nr:YdcF family protein [Phenylobacterium sp.]MDP1640633.1 YdcF family protein [Phenylobacterium sp.]MDP3117163.1 YdcF family protein [Phenylobacterium sp.]MDP3383346.1 YdcF family protein [Phenylobacterium sp.]